MTDPKVKELIDLLKDDFFRCNRRAAENFVRGYYSLADDYNQLVKKHGELRQAVREMTEALDDIRSGRCAKDVDGRRLMTHEAMALHATKALKQVDEIK